MKKLLAIIVLGLLFNGCAGSSYTNNSGYNKYIKNVKKKGAKYYVSMISPSTSMLMYSASFISYDDAYKRSLDGCKKRGWYDCVPHYRGNTLVYKYPTRQERLIAQAQNTCASLGFSRGTNEFRDCTLKVYSKNSSGNRTVVVPRQGGNIDQQMINRGLEMLSPQQPKSILPKIYNCRTIGQNTTCY